MLLVVCQLSCDVSNNLVGFLDNGQCYILQLPSEELNVKKIITIVYATYLQLQKESLNRSQTFDLGNYTDAAL